MHYSTNPVQVKNLSLISRWTSIVGGAALVSFGMKKRSVGGTALAVLGGDLIYCGAFGYSPLRRSLGFAPQNGAPGKSVSIPYRQGIRVDKAITINKPREELYSFWRDLQNLPRFMRHLHSVTITDDKRSHWIAQGPKGKTLEWDAEINNELRNELIAWRSLPGSEVDSAGSVHFKPASGGRGTEVYVELQYNPPGGALGAAFAKLMGHDPASHIMQDLRRLKQLMETGEIATTEGQPTGESAFPHAPVRSRRTVHRDRDRVQAASEESFPASDPPSWTAPQEELVSK